MLTIEQMTERTTAIATLLDTRREYAVGILAGAFGDSPLARYCFSDQGGYYDRAVRAYARLACARHAAAGGAHLVAYHREHLVGVAGITPPRPPRPATPRDQWPWFAAVLGPQAAGRIEEIERAIEGYRPSAPHCTIGALGVLPISDGGGTGGALLDAARAYAEARPAATGVYAAAASPEGIAFFERAGYRLVGRETLDTMTISCLFRPNGAW